MDCMLFLLKIYTSEIKVQISIHDKKKDVYHMCWSFHSHHTCLHLIQENLQYYVYPCQASN
ncbi:hypothetical protein HanIR_Chr12g0609941 [Helianthus annuus]|nr:hypothetical protein HanIR_Chr12g0609941 [Helianthus annuus]